MNIVYLQVQILRTHGFAGGFAQHDKITNLYQQCAKTLTDIMNGPVLCMIGAYIHTP